MEIFVRGPGRTSDPSAALRMTILWGELTERKPLCGSRGALQVPRLPQISCQKP
jgi:hypothetical protein